MNMAIWFWSRTLERASGADRTSGRRFQQRKQGNGILPAARTVEEAGATDERMDDHC